MFCDEAEPGVFVAVCARERRPRRIATAKQITDPRNQGGLGIDAVSIFAQEQPLYWVAHPNVVLFDVRVGFHRVKLRILARLSVAPSIFDEMVLAVDNTGSSSRFRRLGIAYELLGLVHGGNLEQEENVVRFSDGTPDTNQSKASFPVG